MKILVIGASSFTGSHFITYARAKGAEVFEQSLRNLRSLSAALDQEYDHIVNFAALNVVAPSWQYPSDYLFTNTYAMTAVIDILHRKPLKSFVQVSTPEVYGSTSGWIKEDAPYNPSTPYAVSRAAAEMMMKCYAREYGFPVVFTRGANVYGPGQQLYRLIPKLIASIKHGRKFPLEGGGKSERAFVHVDDMVDGIWRVMESGRLGSAYHISSREMQRISDIVFYICATMKVAQKDFVEPVDERPGKDAAYMLDSGRIRAELGWEDKISMDAGIDGVIKWMDEHWADLERKSLDYEHRP